MLKGHWHYLAALFAVLLFTAIMEGIGFSLVVPLLQNLLSPTGVAEGGGVLQRFLSSLGSSSRKSGGSAACLPFWRWCFLSKASA